MNAFGKVSTAVAGAAAGAAALSFAGGLFFYRIGLGSRPFPWDKKPADAWEAPPKPRMTKADGKDVPYDPYGMGEAIHAADLALYDAVAARGRRFELTSYDGLRLAARYLPPEEGEPRAIVLMVHGFRANPMKDFSLAACDLTKKGIGLLMITHRAHGESEGDLITYGVRERFDVRGWAKLLYEQFPGVPVLLYGVSMGAATVMATAGIAPANVRGIVADCGYTNMRAIFSEVISRDYHMNPFPVLNAAEMMNRAREGFGFTDVDSAAELLKATVPVLLIHGKADGFVPFRMGLEIYNKTKDKIDIDFWPVENADHAVSYACAPAEYAEKLDAFIAKCV